MSGLDKCSRCGITETGYASSGEVVCAGCGLILESSFIVAEVQFTNEGVCTSTIIPDTRTSKKSKAEVNVERVVSLFDISQQLSAQCFTLLNNLQSKGNVSRDSFLLAASIVLFVLKQNNKPVSITDMAKTAKVNIFDLGKVYKRVEKLLQHIPPEEVPHTPFLNRAITALNLAEDVVLVVRKQADQLISIANRDCISTGRHPIAVIAAALYLSLEVYCAKKQLTHTYISRIADSLVVSERTIKTRAAEIKKLLVAKYRAIAEAGGIQLKVTKNNLTESIPDLLMMIDAERIGKASQANKQTVQLPTQPPAFLHNQKLREKRLEKLDKAKQRLSATLMGNKDGTTNSANLQRKRSFQEYDEEDRIIEMKVLQGVPDEVILTGYYDTNCSTSAVPVSPGNADTELGEHDLPDDEFHQFIRSDKELEYEKLYDHNSDSKIPTPSPSPYKRKCFCVE